MADRYETLDVLRGVAALAVVVHHLNQVKLPVGLVNHGYLAVDLFFILSGFVVSHAYGDPLSNGLSLRDFLIRRIVRLYPLAVAGVAIGLAVLILKWLVSPDKVDGLSTILLSGLFNAALIPFFFGGPASRHELFPGNGPLYTLSLEFAANVIWAVFSRRLTTLVLSCFVGLNAILLFAIALHYQTLNVGFDVQTAWCGLVRVGFGFPLGVLIYRLHRSKRDVLPTVGSPLLILGLLLVVAAPEDGFGLGNGLWDCLSVLLLFPLIICLGTSRKPESKAGAFVGEISYPIYALHFPILALLSGLVQITQTTMHVYVLSLAMLVPIVGSGVLASRMYDIPLRAALNARLRRRRARKRSEALFGHDR